MVKALKPGGVLLSIEPDMLPCTVAEPESMRSFWQQWLAWSAQSGIDYFIGRKIPAWFDSLRLTDLTSEGHTAQFNGGSNWAIYWMETMQVLTQLCSNLDDSRRKRWKNSSSATKIRITGQVSSPL